MRFILGLCAAAVSSFAQQPPPQKILVAGENPAIRYLDKEGGKPISSVNFWRVHWSPAGPGAICFVTVTDQPSGNLRIAIYDDEKVLDYVSKELMGALNSAFTNPPFTPVKGTITQTNAGPKEHKETCKSDRYTVELLWHGLGDANFVDYRPGGNVMMTFAMVMASSGEIIINGKQAPGKWFATGGGIGTGAYLALNEIWRPQ